MSNEATPEKATTGTAPPSCAPSNGSAEPLKQQGRIPKSFLDEGLELAKGATVFGLAMESLTRDEALACAAQFGKQYNDLLKDQNDRTEP